MHTVKYHKMLKSKRILLERILASKFITVLWHIKETLERIHSEQPLHKHIVVREPSPSCNLVYTIPQLKNYCK